jgi:hypothetical protein
MNDHDHQGSRIPHRRAWRTTAFRAAPLILLFLVTAGLAACQETPQQAEDRKRREESICLRCWSEGQESAVAVRQELAQVRQELTQVRQKLTGVSKELQQAIVDKKQARIDAEEWVRRELRRIFPGSPPPFSGWRGTVYKGMVFGGAGELLLALLFACGFLIFSNSTVRERAGTAMATALGAVVALWLSSGFWGVIERSQAALLAPANRFGLEWLVVGSLFAVVAFLANAYFFRAFVIDRRRGARAALGAFVVGATTTVYVLAMPLILKPRELLGTEVTQHLASHVFLGVLIGGTVHLVWVFISHREPLLRRPRPRLYLNSNDGA